MEKIWVPNNYESSNLFEFERFLEKKYDLSFSNYIELHEWSIKNLGSFWESISEFYKIQFDENTESLFSTLITGNTPAFTNASTKMYQIPYRKIQEFMFTNDLKLLSGTWNVMAEDDSENKTTAENGPFNISINASSLSVEELLTPKEFKLYSNFPNPFNPSTTILYALPEKSHVSIEIYDILGKRIKVLVSESQNMGHHSKIWDGTNEQGEIVSGGVYIYVLNAGSYYDTKKMIYMK